MRKQRFAVFVGCLIGIIHLGLFGKTKDSEATTHRSLPQNVAYKLYGLNFGPFIGDGEDPNLGSKISENQLRARLRIIAPYTQWIRTYGCNSGLEKAGPIAKSMGLKTAISAWIGHDLAANAREISCLIRVAREGHVDLATVGIEVLHRGDLSEDQLITYINRVKREVPEVPLATADVFNKLLSHPAVTSAGDVVLVNYYPYWVGIKIEQSIAALHAWHQQVKEVSRGKRVIVSETGWPTCGNRIGDAVPSLKNASFYFREFIFWARANDVPYFYFEALDEQWKTKYEGPQGACWGIFDKDGNLKPAMKDVFAK